MSAFEYQVLNTVCNHPEVYQTLTVTSDQFEDPRAREMLEVLGEIIGEGKSPDLFLVTEMMNFRNGRENLPFVGDVLDRYYGVPGNIEAYCRNIKADWRKRREEQIAQELILGIRSGDPDAATKAMNDLRDMETGRDTGTKSVSELMPGVLEVIGKRYRKEIPPGVPSGWYEVDRLLGGFQASDMIVLAARTGVGKTAAMVNLALNCRVPCGIISAEQSSQQLVERMLANRSGVPGHRIRTGRFEHESELGRVMEAGKKITQIHIADQSMPTIDQVESTARRMQWESGIKVLFVDYLQYIRSLRYDQKYQQVGDVSARLKGLAKELNIPVVALAQLNRQAEGRDPQISDLRESGDIEQDADVIMLLCRREETKDQIEVMVAKNRHGAAGKSHLMWDGEHMRIRNPVKKTMGGMDEIN